MTPLITLDVHQLLQRARGRGELACSLDLGRTQTKVHARDDAWEWQGREFPYLERCKERTVYYWTANGFEPVARFNGALIKLVPTEWGAPTFEIDGIKMLPTAKISPYEDAKNKVALIEPRGKRVLDTCGGLGYFASWCLQGGAAEVVSFEKNADVLWLRTLNPWSPSVGSSLTLHHDDIAARIATLPDRGFDALLHDPPRFGIAGELYSQTFYDHLARVVKPGGKLFHYTGTPNKLTSGRDVPNEVAKRLQIAGFAAKPHGDGVLAALKRARRP